MQHRDACTRHQGVQSYAPAPTSASRTDKTAFPMPASPAPILSAEPAAAPLAFNPSAPPSAASERVWVSNARKVYHSQGDRWYGKTEADDYTTEAAARAEDDRPDYGRACS